MFFARKNRRRFQNGPASNVSACISGRQGESLESRQLLTAVSMAPDTQETRPVEIDMAAMDAMFASHENMLASEALYSSSMSNALPLPPAIPDGLSEDISEAGHQAIEKAQSQYDTIQQLQQQKHDCEEAVRQLQSEADAAETALNSAKAEQAAKESALNNAQSSVESAQQNLNDQRAKLKKLQEDLRSARRARNSHARVISLAARLAGQARRAGNHAAAASLARQVQVNYEKYAEKNAEVRRLKNEIQQTRQDLRNARADLQAARQARNAARAELNQAKAATARAQQAYNQAVARLNAAKQKCRDLCDRLMAEEQEYRGENGSHAAAVDAIENGRAEQIARIAREKQAEKDAAEEREAAALRARNFIQPLDLNGMRGKDRGDLTPCDIAILIGQQGNSSAPSNPTGQQLAQAAAILALKSKGTREGLKAIGNALLGAAWNQLTSLVPVLGALEKLYNNVEGLKNFIQDFKDGNIKHQRYHWFPEWGSVQTDVFYNCKTGQYISKTTVVFYVPGPNHAGGAGRNGIFVPPHLGGKSFTVTHFGTVKP